MAVNPASVRTCGALLLAVAWTAAFALTVCAGAAQSTGGFVPLFNGTLDGWTIENSEEGNFVVRAASCELQGRAAGCDRHERTGHIGIQGETGAMEYRVIEIRER